MKGGGNEEGREGVTAALSTSITTRAPTSIDNRLCGVWCVVCGAKITSERACGEESGYS